MATKLKPKTTPKLKIKAGDSVQVLTGKDAGKRGTVTRVLPHERRIVVEKVNMIKRHTKPRPAPRASGSQQIIPGGVLEREAPLQISNVALVCPACGKPSRVGYRINEKDGNKVRVCKSCGKDVDR
jgi:large subunit ribosomal protein L24